MMRKAAKRDGDGEPLRRLAELEAENAALRRRAADTAAEAERRIDDLLEGIGEAFYALDRDWRFITFNRAAERYFGRPRETMLGRRIWDLFPWTEGSDLRRRMEELMESGGSDSFELDSVAVPGRRVEFHFFPFRGGLGLAFRDWTERWKAEAGLRESEERFRTMADSAPALIWMTDADGRIVFANRHYEEVFGLSMEELRGNGWKRIVHPEDAEAFTARFMEAFVLRAPFKGEVRVHDRDGRTRWLRCEGAARFDDAGAFLGYTGCNVDVTDAKLAAERQQLLVDELNHRVKNTLATVQSIAAQSFRGEGAAEKARTLFEARLLALSKAHDVLTRESWQGADLWAVVREAIEPHRGGERFRVRGPALRLSPREALALAMGLHELCTNAAKHGALSNGTGEVLLDWTTADRRLRLRWEERGGPAVTPPSRTGFGTRLIERGLARELDGEARLLFEPAGLVFTLDVPLNEPFATEGSREDAG
jgi:PAS domain S-box-containing protein